jgi:rhamnosyl/mannosyltransferase
VRVLARAQAELGIEVRVLCVNHADRNGRDVTWRPFARTATVEEEDGRVHVTRIGRRASLARLDVCPDLPGRLRALERAGTDIFHLHTPNVTMLLAVAAMRPAARLVVTVHSDVVRQQALKLAIRPFEHVVLSRAARILSDSPAYSAGSTLLQRHARKVSVLPLGIDVALFKSPSAGALACGRRLRAAHGTPLWLCVGRLVYYKGLFTALAALARVPGKLVVLGTGPLERALKRRARELGVAERVVFGGRASDDELVGAYHAATALWFPSTARSEGFGLVQVEAMASGCPVINTAIPSSGVPWVSPHEQTGLTVPVNDAAALAGAARRLLEEPGLRDRLAAAGRARAAAEFDQLVMGRRSVALYRETLDGLPFR